MLRQLIFKTSDSLRKLGIGFNNEDNRAVLQMRKAINELDGGIQFQYEFFPDGSWTAESKNIDGIITGGKSRKDIIPTVKDAIFTYFSIPPQRCDDVLLHSSNEPVTAEQRVWATK